MHHTSIIADKKSHLIFSILKTNLDVCLVGLFVLMIDSNAIGQWFNVRSKRMNSNINTKWILRLCIFSSITLSLLCVWFPFRMKCIFFVAIFFSLVFTFPHLFEYAQANESLVCDHNKEREHNKTERDEKSCEIFRKRNICTIYQSKMSSFRVSVPQTALILNPEKPPILFGSFLFKFGKKTLCTVL